jgi:hypothetical protein
MANGRRFNHAGDAAASKTLPLGTVAKVTNLKNGRTAVVTVEDHGPYVDGRTIDLTKTTSEQIGIGAHEGVAPVIVAPIAVPQPDGTIKPGAGALPGPASAPKANWRQRYPTRKTTWRTLIPTDPLALKAYVRLRVVRLLILVKFSDLGWGRLGATAEVAHGGKPYDGPQAWSKAGLEGASDWRRRHSLYRASW